MKSLFKHLIIQFLKIMNKTLLLRFGIINQIALGHLAFDTEVNYLNSTQTGAKVKDFWFLHGETVNSTLTNFWKTKLGARDNRIRLKVYSAIESSGFLKENLLSFDLGAGAGSVLDSYPRQFEFSAEEQFLISQLMPLMNLYFDKKRTVIFCLRDDAYYKKINTGSNQSIHKHRNVNSDNYIEAIEWLLARDINVVRMGRLAEKKLPIKHCNFLDLPFEERLCVDRIGLRNRELIELFLFQKASFTISTGLGTDSLSTLFRKPVYLCDYYSTHNLYSSRLYPLVLPKGYVDVNSEELIPFKSIFASDYFKGQFAHDFDRYGVKLRDCNTERIRNFVAQALIHFQSNTNMYDNETLSKAHAESLKKSVFGNRFIPKISSLWENNI